MAVALYVVVGERPAVGFLRLCDVKLAPCLVASCGKLANLHLIASLDALELVSCVAEAILFILLLLGDGVQLLGVSVLDVAQLSLVADALVGVSFNVLLQKAMKLLCGMGFCSFNSLGSIIAHLLP